MKLSWKVTPLTMLILASTAFAAKIVYQDQERSSIQVRELVDGRSSESIRTASFEVARDYGAETLAPVLLKKITEIETVEGLEGSSGRLWLTARGSSHSPHDKVLYQLQEAAHDAAFAEDGLLVTWLHGCCDAATAYRAFHLQSGKQLFSYDDRSGQWVGRFTPPFVLEVPNTPLRRFIGLLTESATRDFQPGALGEHEKVATLFYSGLDGLKESIDLYAKVPEFYGMNTSARLLDLAGGNEIRENRLTLWSSDGILEPAQAFRGFGVEITFSAAEEVKVTIPFSGDSASLDGLSLPESIRIQRSLSEGAR
jgi:hypothetical protein